jgi:acylphosphatase
MLLPGMQRCHVLFSGRVQGVGFRWRAARCAAGVPVAGWVRNLPDGRVELVAEGARDDVEALLRAIRGQMGDLIEGEQATWGPPEGGLEDFRIVR